jgi:hypothetical protein
MNGVKYGSKRPQIQRMHHRNKRSDYILQLDITDREIDALVTE